MTEEQLGYLFSKVEYFAQKESSDSETKVGAITEGTLPRIMATNKFVRGAKGLPSVRPDKYQYIIHAEQNLIFQAAKHGIPLKGQVVVCTLSPCQACIRAMFQAGITEVYYKDTHRDHNPNMRDIEVTETKVGPYTKMVLSNYESQT